MVPIRKPMIITIWLLALDLRRPFRQRPLGYSLGVRHLLCYPDSNVLLGLVRTPPFVLLQVINNDVPTASAPVPRRNLANYFLGQPLVDVNATQYLYGGTDYATTYTQSWNLNIQHQFCAQYPRLKSDMLQTKELTRSTSSRAIFRSRDLGIFEPAAISPMGSAGLQNLGRVEHLRKPPSKGREAIPPADSPSSALRLVECLDGPGSEEGGSPDLYLDNLNKGRCDFDVPQNFVTSYIWELPFGKGESTSLAHRVRSISLSVAGNGRALILYSPGYLTRPLSTWIGPTRVQGRAARAIAPPAVPQNLNCWYFASSNPACRALLPNQTDTFVLPGVYTYGNSGRNILGRPPDPTRHVP